MGIDVAFFAGGEAVRQNDEEQFFDGPPVLAVGVLSPSDVHDGVIEKMRRYLAAGTRQVWIVDPEVRTVTVHRSDAEPVLFNANQTIAGGPGLEGFEAEVSSLFSGKRAAR